MTKIYKSKRIRIYLASAVTLLILLGAVAYIVKFKSKASEVVEAPGNISGILSGNLDYSKTPKIVIGGKATRINSDGSFIINNLPPGNYRYSIWDIDKYYISDKDSSPTIEIESGNTTALDVEELRISGSNHSCSRPHYRSHREGGIHAD